MLKIVYEKPSLIPDATQVAIGLPSISLNFFQRKCPINPHLPLELRGRMLIFAMPACWNLITLAVYRLPAIRVNSHGPRGSSKKPLHGLRGLTRIDEAKKTGHALHELTQLELVCGNSRNSRLSPPESASIREIRVSARQASRKPLTKRKGAESAECRREDHQRKTCLRVRGGRTSAERE